MSEPGWETVSEHPLKPGPADHLKEYQWEKGGPSPNPSGRPKGRKSLAGEVERVLHRRLSDDDAKLRIEEYAEMIVDEIIAAPSGRASVEIMARLWPAKTQLELMGTSAAIGPLTTWSP